MKLRDWNPYEGQKIASTVLALRVEPGQPYDTYTGWFLDQQTQQWRLYASGRKWSEKRSVTSLLPGCFVEVPGPPHVERTGHIPRAADFRGWCRDDNGKWHPLDVMNGSKADANREQTNCLWSLSEDGWFRMAMGGMTHFRYPKGVDVTAPKMKTMPDYLSEAALKTCNRADDHYEVRWVKLSDSLNGLPGNPFWHQADGFGLEGAGLGELAGGSGDLAGEPGGASGVAGDLRGGGFQ